MGCGSSSPTPAAIAPVENAHQEHSRAATPDSSQRSHTGASAQASPPKRAASGPPSKTEQSRAAPLATTVSSAANLGKAPDIDEPARMMHAYQVWQQKEAASCSGRHPTATDEREQGTGLHSGLSRPRTSSGKPGAPPEGEAHANSAASSSLEQARAADAEPAQPGASNAQHGFPNDLPADEATPKPSVGVKVSSCRPKTGDPPCESTSTIALQPFSWRFVEFQQGRV